MSVSSSQRENNPASDCVSNPTDLPSQRENVYPERPDEAECEYYMKTGFCGYGAKCRFHHPRERLITASKTASSEKHDDPDEPKRLVSKLQFRLSAVTAVQLLISGVS